MSETLRVLGAPVGRRGRKRHARRAGRIILGIVVFLAIYALWTTRDSFSMARLIPGQQQYRMFTNDLMGNRGRVAGSEVWQTLPESWGLSDLQAKLNENLSLPEWVLNNWIGRVCQFSGNDTDGFKDLLLVTRMRRVGCLVERMYRWTHNIERDWAGGLNLRRLPDANLYYAVRGRVLLVSASRDALIRALTLSEENALPEDVLEHAEEAFGAEDMHGAFAFSGPPRAWQPDEKPSTIARLQHAFASLTFAMRIEKSQACVKLRGVVRPECKEKLNGIFDAASPQSLREPPDGPIAISVNLGRPVREVWNALAGLADDPAPWRQMWEDWATQSTGSPEAAQAMSSFLTTVLGPAGPEFRAAWRGVDLDAILPTPEFAGIFATDPATRANWFAGLPPVPEGALPWDTYPRVNLEQQRAWLPMPGGSALEPAAVFSNDQLIVSTSRSGMEAMLSNSLNAQPIETPANIYLRIRPKDFAESVYAAGNLLARDGMLRGKTPESFEEDMKTWRERGAKLDVATASMACENGEITAEFHLTCAPETTAQ